ncbi:uncharacterized protein LOC106657560 isoform X2 [Trichogramma pretiosum]|uniref:uncharacterized protein LOC106657560 isoform X2 n=1 Tax=Trichogramma pretiosum TaxID=7493 RepID=UPI000C719791|nr:uncharacterized protein LOC106657560 isoform X2 [Trichogramma pretiosum]
MPHLAKILSLFLLATICCSLSALASRHSNDHDDDPPNFIFDRQSYKNDSYVKLICTWYNPHRGVTKCKINAVKAKPGENDVPESKKRCEVWLSADRKLGGNETRVLRFGPDKAIVSWQAPTWRMSIVHFDNCTVYPSSDMWLRLRDFQPVSYVVYENSFDVVVGSENFPECRIPSSGHDVPRCRITFDERGLPVHRDPDHRVWFNQSVRDDDMILEPLDQESPASGHLLIDTIAPDDEEANQTTTVRAAIVQPDGQILELRRYEQFWYKGVDPYKLVAHSTAHGLIGVCVGLIDRNEFTCSQFDRRGQLKFETTSDELSLSLEFDVINLAEDGMLLTYIERAGPGPWHYSNNPMLFHTARIDGSDGGGVHKYVFGAMEWYECQEGRKRAGVELYEQQQPGHYCITEICYKDPKGYSTRRSRWLDFKPLCFTDESQR